MIKLHHFKKEFWCWNKDIFVPETTQRHLHQLVPTWSKLALFINFLPSGLIRQVKLQTDQREALQTLNLHTDRIDRFIFLLVWLDHAALQIAQWWSAVPDRALLLFTTTSQVKCCAWLSWTKSWLKVWTFGMFSRWRMKWLVHRWVQISSAHAANASAPWLWSFWSFLLFVCMFFWKIWWKKISRRLDEDYRRFTRHPPIILPFKK